MDSRQADQASTEPRGIHSRGTMSAGGGEREGDRAPVCPCLAYLSLRSVGQFRPKWKGRRREGDGTVTMSVQYNLPVCWY